MAIQDDQRSAVEDLTGADTTGVEQAVAVEQTQESRIDISAADMAPASLVEKMAAEETDQLLDDLVKLTGSPEDGSPGPVDTVREQLASFEQCCDALPGGDQYEDADAVVRERTQLTEQMKEMVDNLASFENAMGGQISNLPEAETIVDALKLRMQNVSEDALNRLSGDYTEQFSRAPLENGDASYGFQVDENQQTSDIQKFIKDLSNEQANFDYRIELTSDAADASQQTVLVATPRGESANEGETTLVLNNRDAQSAPKRLDDELVDKLIDRYQNQDPHGEILPKLESYRAGEDSLSPADLAQISSSIENQQAMDQVWNRNEPSAATISPEELQALTSTADSITVIQVEQEQIKELARNIVAILEKGQPLGDNTVSELVGLPQVDLIVSENSPSLIGRLGGHSSTSELDTNSDTYEILKTYMEDNGLSMDAPGDDSRSSTASEASTDSDDGVVDLGEDAPATEESSRIAKFFSGIGTIGTYVATKTWAGAGFLNKEFLQKIDLTNGYRDVDERRKTPQQSPGEPPKDKTKSDPEADEKSDERDTAAEQQAANNAKRTDIGDEFDDLLLTPDEKKPDTADDESLTLVA